jgi:hypothetical protein
MTPGGGNMSNFSVRAVVFREGEHWVAQCLEYRYAIQARRLEDIPRVLRSCLKAQILVSRENGIEPFHGFEPAPKRYWDMYDHADPLPESIEAREDDSPLPGIGPAEVLAPTVLRNFCSLFNLPFEDFGLVPQKDE